MPKLQDPQEEEELEELRAFYALLKDFKFEETGDPNNPIWKGTHELTHQEYTLLLEYHQKIDEIYWGKKKYIK
jgi:hypothetical protein